MRPLHARITMVDLLGYKIKVTEHTDTLSMGPNHEITVALRAAVGEPDANGVRVTVPAIAEVLNAVPRIAGYEIMDAMGNGLVVVI